ncbi:hypothetical protein GFK26_18105 [Variovorax paradoxus]|uniref:DUF4148 domain-containing protein n=1 Tax=Variovorax paradoxus TaxID=34073 RepID=A0A5Q0M828_VARPD|nr:hypothetical protein [Variovorax paradoxus]QFZ84542.1 hypothetical protein GFK26_18105 [Variovorax paradoxus]
MKLATCFISIAALLTPFSTHADGSVAKRNAQNKAAQSGGGSSTSAKSSGSISQGSPGNPYGWTVSGGGMATEHVNSPEAAKASMEAREARGATYSAADKAKIGAGYDPTAQDK